MTSMARARSSPGLEGGSWKGASRMGLSLKLHTSPPIPPMVAYFEALRRRVPHRSPEQYFRLRFNRGRLPRSSDSMATRSPSSLLGDLMECMFATLPASSAPSWRSPTRAEQAPARGREPRQEAGLLIKAAAQAIGEAMTAIFEAGSSDEPAGSRKELQAIHFCLSSAAGLLGVSETLIGNEPGQGAARDAHSLQRVADDANAAGKAAGKAVLVLEGNERDTASDIKRPWPFIC